MFSRKIVILSFLKLILLNACINIEDKEQRISGNIDYTGNATLSISKIPLHYKYSPTNEFLVTPDDNGDFSLNIPIDNNDQLLFSIDDNSFLLIADVNDQLDLKIQRSSFPLDIEINSNNISDYTAYKKYLNSISGLDSKIEKEMNKYKAGLENSAIVLSKQKISLAKKHLAETAYENLILKAKGELVVNKIKSIE
jgi:hypothetical protein